MAISKTLIINKALTEVGAQPITNIDDGTNNARIINRVYEIALRGILAECNWNFAKKRSLLSVSADTLPWYDVGETVVYARPTDLIKIFRVSYRPAVWREEGDYIISDTADLGIEYVYYLDDPTKYSMQFIEAFVDKLASDAAYMIVNSASLGRTYKELYEGVSLPKAISSNSQIGKQQEMKDDAWELAKYANTHPDA